jgi:hypothetical protein
MFISSIDNLYEKFYIQDVRHALPIKKMYGFM